MELEVAKPLTIVTYVPQDFPRTFNPWMRMTHGQFVSTMSWLYDEIGLKEGMKKFNVAEPVMHGTFDGARQLIWRHRQKGIVGDGGHIMEYQVCEVGKPKDPLITGEFELRPCA